MRPERADSRGFPPSAQKLLLSLATVAICLGGAEAVARLRERSGRTPPVAPYITDWAAWDGDFYTVKTTAVGWPPWEDYNHEGLRDREHEVERRPGTRRVVCLGDSTTLGWGLPPEEAYPQVLQDRLDALGGGVEVFNVALGGWSTRQERIAYRNIARKYEPDQVLLGVCLNDIPEMQNNLTHPPRLLASLFGHSALVRAVVDPRGREIRDVRELFDRPSSPNVQAGYRRLFEDVRSLRDEVRADGAEFAVLIFPFRLQVSAQAPAPLPQRAIADFCAREGIAWLDLLPALRRTEEAAYLDLDHLSAAGNRVVADELLDQGLLLAGRGPQRPEGGERRRASAVGGTGGRPLRELLVALHSPDRSQRVSAARALGHRPGEALQAMPGLVALLGDPAPEVRAAAAWAVGEIGERGAEAVGALEALLEDASAGARAGAAWALGRIGAPSRAASLALARRLLDEDEGVRWRAGNALEAIGPDPRSCLPVLIDILARPDARGREEAAAVVGRMGPAAQDAVPALIDALRDPREQVRGRAAWALGQIGPEARGAVPALIEAMKDDAIRWRAIDAVGGIGPGAEPAVPLLTAALADTSSNVRWRAAGALGRVGPGAREAVPALIERLDDPHENVRLAAVKAIVRVGGGPKATVPAFTQALRDTDSRVRMEAVEGIGHLGAAARPATSALIAMLNDPDPAVRAAAVRVLGRLGPLTPAVRRALLAASRDRDERVRAEAARTLRKARPG